MVEGKNQGIGKRMTVSVLIEVLRVEFLIYLLCRENRHKQSGIGKGKEFILSDNEIPVPF